MCIGTADKRIIIYDLGAKQGLREMLGHETQVRQMSFVPGSGGLLVSIGFEHSARVWQPSNLVGNNFLGKLKGHAHVITSVVTVPD